jgi:hypothetical protein
MEPIDYLRALRDNVCGPYIGLPQTKAILSMGSVAYGIVDRYSDIDIAIYCDELPSEDQLRGAMLSNGAAELGWILGDHESGGLIESYHVNGVECQFAHSTIALWESYMDSVLVSLDVDSPIQKALSGILVGVPIYGPELIERFKARAREYPPSLAKAMVEKYMAFPRLWVIGERLQPRDALLWRQQSLVESGYSILGVLAGLNRLYFTTFQFKGMRALIDSMAWKPENLASRIESMLTKPYEAIDVLRWLISETLDLVEAHMPEVDTSAERARWATEAQAWAMPVESH